MKKKTGIIVSVMLLALSLTACGNSASSATTSFSVNSKMAPMEAESAVDSGFYDEEMATEESTSDFEKDDSLFNDSARKLIKTENLSVETENFDDLVTAVEARIKDLHGYIQSQNTYNNSLKNTYASSRSCDMTVRIPTANLDTFVDFVGANSNVVNKYVNVEDVTLNYVDTESKKKTYEIEQERLLALLEKCDNVEDMIAIESRLSEVRYKLEAQESTLRTYDNLVDYATVNINIEEVTKYTEPEPESYGQRLARAFRGGLERTVNGLKDFLVGFVNALPGLFVFIIICLIVFFIIRGISKASNKKRALKNERNAELKMNQAKETAREKAGENATKL
ncbi:MAG: DUF4349 domain-containing protein [Lachnospiraceae bacterium]|nr:DUF4349 domain-containing protein [Lachnospiraceae bacterium]